MKVDWNSKYTTISTYTIITFTICVLIVALVLRFSQVASFLSSCISAASPIVWGCVIAYLLNPIMQFCEKWLKKLIEKKKPYPRLCRGLATAAAIIVGLAVIAALIAVLVPQVIESILNIFNNIPSYMSNIQSFVSGVNSRLPEYPDVVAWINTTMEQLQDTLTDTINNILPKLGEWAVKLRDGAIGLIGGLKDFLIGFIIAVYLLIDKEKFITGTKKLTIAVFPKSASREILSLSRRINRSMSGFISGKIVDSIIIGMICFICMTVMQMDYSVLISTIIGVTNVIPFFGPFIGARPSTFLLRISTPSQCIPFIIMILVLQQFDGNILGPYILGDSTGLPSFWTVFAILFGGSMFGFAGMLLGVPVFAVIYAVVKEIIESLLIKKGLPVDDSYYAPVPPEERHRIIKINLDFFKKKKGGNKNDNK